MILACKSISKSFGTTEVLSDISFHINEREKAAIVGINGAGKSTLFKIIMGEMSLDEGEVIFAKGTSVGYLSQHQDVSGDNTLYEELLTVKKDVIELDKNIRQMELDMKSKTGDELERMLATYTRLTHEFEQKNGYAYKSEVTGVLKGLGFTSEEFDKSVTTLSGGQKTRLSLGKLLLSSPDLILLDEPTNHLDMESITALNNGLMKFSGVILFTSQDHQFVQTIANRIFEITPNGLIDKVTTYDEYLDNDEFARKRQVMQIDREDDNN